MITGTETPKEYISLPDAIQTFGKSKETIRRYKRQGKIKDTELRNGRLYLNKRELYNLLLVMNRGREEAQPNPSPVVSMNYPPIHDEYPENTTKSPVEHVYQTWVDDLKEDKRVLQEEKKELDKELKLTEAKLHDAHLKIMALERKITGEPKALLEEDVPENTTKSTEEPTKEHFKSLTGLNIRRNVFGKVLGFK